ncbi:MAG: esterase-like activity of phytase family protein [Bacteroidota bacterium]
MKKKGLFILAIFICAVVSAQKKNSIGRLKLISEYDLPHNLSFKGTTVGGLSGIDYDRAQGLYYMICDDRSAINAARYYTARIFLNNKKIDSVVFVNVTTLLQKGGNPYPNSKQDPLHTPDPEAMRYNPVRKQMAWSSEGERILKDKDTVLEDPSITVMSVNGKYIDTFLLPENLRMQATEKGPRKNGVLEGMSFANNFRTLYVNVEEPLYEDGPRADIMENDPWIRIFKFNTKTKQNTAQYAYKLDPVAYPSTPATAFKVNGVPDILSAGNGQFIVLERSFSTGRLPCTIKIFLANLKGATDVSNNPSLITNKVKNPVTKKLLLNMDSLGVYIDNIEGVTFGPRLANGHRTLLLVADNNFEAFQKTQFFLFEVIP